MTYTARCRLVDKNQVLLLVQATKYSRDHKMYEFMYRAVQKWNPNTFFRNSGYCQHLAETKINYLAYIATCIIIKHVQQPHKNTSIIFICPMYCHTLQLVTCEAKGSNDESFSYADPFTFQLTNYLFIVDYNLLMLLLVPYYLDI